MRAGGPGLGAFHGLAGAFGGLIAMTSEEGETFMLKAGPTHEIVRTNTIDEPVYRRPRSPTEDLHSGREAPLRDRRSAGGLVHPRLRPGLLTHSRAPLRRRAPGDSLARLARILE
jgi:hypothetical protein